MVCSKSCLIKTEDVGLTIDGISVLERLSLILYSGEIHAIVGDHDSGKTYIGELLSGVYSHDSGNILIDGVIVNNLTITKAQKLGIYTIHQDTHLIDDFNIAENLFTPSDLKVGFRNRKARYLQEADKILKSFNIEIDPSRLYKNLMLSEKIVICIIRALIRNPRLLILDESLDKLSGKDLIHINSILDSHVSRGMALLCLSHKIDDIYSFADSVSILKKGHIYITDYLQNMDRLNLIKLCYSQLNSRDNSDSAEFYQILKYNEAILQKLPTNLIVIDVKKEIKLINDTAKKFFEIEGLVLRGKPVDILFEVNNREFQLELTKALSHDLESISYNIPFRQNGIIKSVNLKTLSIYDGSFLIGNILIIEDITEQEKLREQINLSEKLASVGLLAAGVAHEINNPLEIIYNHLNYLSLAIKGNEFQEVISEIEEELKDIKLIVSNLISFSDNNNTSGEVYNINSLIQSLINLIRFNAKYKSIQISFKSSWDEILVKTSKNEMKQVLLNLLKNSFEAMEEGGYIHIRSDIENIEGNNHASITLEDTGPGIDIKHSNDIFLPFFSTKKKSDHNMGLGLSVIYGIIKKYNGEITATNLDRGGCCFKINLPLI